MDRAEKAVLQLQAVSVLRILKETRTYDGLTELTGLPASGLNRYVDEHVLPGIGHIRGIVRDVGHDTFTDELGARVRFDDKGYVNNSGVVSDQSFLNLVVSIAVNALDLERPDMILTAATGGIALGTVMASYFDARLAYVKKSRETIVKDFVESRQRLVSGTELTHYLPTSVIDDGEHVLVVDDLIRSGRTQKLLLDIVPQADADIADVFVPIVVDDKGTNRARELIDAPVDALSSFDWRLRDPPKSCSESLSLIIGDVEMDTYVPFSYTEWAV